MAIAAVVAVAAVGPSAAPKKVAVSVRDPKVVLFVVRVVVAASSVYPLVMYVLATRPAEDVFSQHVPQPKLQCVHVACV